MKSSSALFPVSLLRADILGELSEDVYLVKHNRDKDKSVEVAVSHLSLKNRTPSNGPLVLVHGSFTNRGFWLSRKGEGMARYLLEQGFDLWLMEHRGHGNSPRNDDYRHNTVERYALFDLPAVNEFVQEKSGQIPAWVGHSLGGVMIAAALAAGALHPNNCRAMVLFGTQVIKRPAYLWVPFMRLRMKLKAARQDELYGRALRIGPENEPFGIIKEFVDRYKLFGGWRFAQSKINLLPLWQKDLGVPLLNVAGVADTTDPVNGCQRFGELYGGGNKENLLLGKVQGFSRDYGHIDMVVSKDAACEVWPRISAWLAAS